MGLIVTASPVATRHRDLIVTLAARHQLPAIYASRHFRHRRRLDLLRARFDRPVPARGWLYRRILKGGKTADLPVQAPTKFETVINLKTAKALAQSLAALCMDCARQIRHARTAHRGGHHAELQSRTDTHHARCFG
jgi:putative ABC transport system substrate-binding protein